MWFSSFHGNPNCSVTCSGVVCWVPLAARCQQRLSAHGVRKVSGLEGDCCPTSQVSKQAREGKAPALCQTELSARTSWGCAVGMSQLLSSPPGPQSVMPHNGKTQRLPGFPFPIPTGAPSASPPQVTDWPSGSSETSLCIQRPLEGAPLPPPHSHPQLGRA